MLLCKQALRLALLSDSEMLDSLDLQINIRNKNNQRLDIQSVIESIPSGGSSTITWPQFMSHFSSSVEIRQSAQEQAMSLLVDQDGDQTDDDGTNETEGEKKDGTTKTVIDEKEISSSPFSNDGGKAHLASPDHHWFDRLDSALSNTPPHSKNDASIAAMTPTGQRLMEQYQAISSVSESQLHLSTLATPGTPESKTTSTGLRHDTSPPSSSTDTSSLKNTFLNTLTPNGQALQERVSMVARAQGLIRGLTRTGTTAPNPDDLMSRISTFASSSLNEITSASLHLSSSTSTNNPSNTPAPLTSNNIRKIVSPPSSIMDRNGRLLQSQYANNSFSHDVPSSLPISIVEAKRMPIKSPRTPEAIRELFDFSRRKTRPRKQYEDLELSPVKSTFSADSAADGTISDSRINYYQSSPIRSPLRNEPRMNVSSIGSTPLSLHSSTLIANSDNTQNNIDNSSSRSAAMSLLTSLRESLNRNEGHLDFHDSPTMMNVSRTSPSKGSVPTAPLEEVEQEMNNQINLMLERSNMSPSNLANRKIRMTMPEVDSFSSPTPDSVTKSLDTVTKSALDVLSRLRRTNQSLFGQDTVNNNGPDSPSFSYLSSVDHIGESSGPAASAYSSRITELLAHSTRSIEKSMEKPVIQQQHPMVHISRRGSINITMQPIQQAAHTAVTIDEPTTPGVMKGFKKEDEKEQEIAEPTTPGKSV